MKVLTILTIIITAASCGYQETLRNNCHLEETTCNSLFGTPKEDTEALEAKIKELGNKIYALQTTVLNTLEDTSNLSIQIEKLKLQMYDAPDSITYLELQEQISLLSDKVEQQQVILNDLVADIAELVENSERELIIYPCPLESGRYNTSVIKLKNGNYITYLNNKLIRVKFGKKYKDDNKCEFSISEDGQITVYDKK